jgi:outer membrane immunogenic protein
LVRILCRRPFGRRLDQGNVSIRDLSVEQDLSLQSKTDDQFIGGVHLGYNLQGAHILYGVEGDASFADNISFLASIPGRLGWASDSCLIVGTAGVAFIDADENFTVVSADDGPFKFSHDGNEIGFVVGGGVGYKVMPNVSLGAEGLFYGFTSDGARLIAGDEPFVLHDHPEFSVVRARLTYFFNSGY